MNTTADFSGFSVHLYIVLNIYIFNVVKQTTIKNYIEEGSKGGSEAEYVVPFDGGSCLPTFI